MTWLDRAQADGAILIWLGDTASGGTALNLSTIGTPATYDGAISGDVVLDVGGDPKFPGLKYPSARMRFNGSAATGIVKTAVPIAEIAGKNKLTIETFLDAHTDTNANCYFAHGDNSASSNLYCSGNTPTGYVEIGLKTGGGIFLGSFNLAAADRINVANAERQLVLRYDDTGASVGTEVKIAIDKVEVATFARTGAIDASTLPFCIGNFDTVGGAPAKTLQRGTAVYPDVLLSQAQIDDHYAAAAADVAPSLDALVVDYSPAIATLDAMIMDAVIPFASLDAIIIDKDTAAPAPSGEGITPMAGGVGLPFGVWRQ